VSKEKPKNLSASIKQRLLNLAREKNDDFQLVLIRYGVERLLYRISVSKHSRQFILKGAMLFQLWTGQPHRSTMDVDLLGSGDDDTGRLVTLFKAICTEVVEDDGLTFVSSSVQGEQIREEHRYGGIRVRMTAKLGNVRIPIQIDVGVGDVVTPKPTQIEYPSLLGLPTATLWTYPKETVVAEKFESMVSLGIANSRMKDFYDVWVLAQDFEFDGSVLATAVRATFRRRGTDLPASPPLALTEEFANDSSKQKQWSAFVGRGRLLVTPPKFQEVVDVLAEFLSPVTEALISDSDFKLIWRARGPWR